jgi:hypothetical protein
LVNVGCLFKSEYESPWETTALLISRGWNVLILSLIHLMVFASECSLHLQDFVSGINPLTDLYIYIAHNILFYLSAQGVGWGLSIPRKMKQNLCRSVEDKINDKYYKLAVILMCTVCKWYFIYRCLSV